MPSSSTRPPAEEEARAEQMAADELKRFEQSMNEYFVLYCVMLDPTAQLAEHGGLDQPATFFNSSCRSSVCRRKDAPGE